MGKFKESSGMTLIELIVSLGIMVMVLSAVFSFYSAGMKSWLISENQMEVLQNARIALEWISRDLKVASEYEILSRQEISITSYQGKIIYEHDDKEKQLIMKKNSDIMPVADYIVDLRFEEDSSGAIVIIELTAESNSYEVKLSTKIAPPVMKTPETEET